MKYLSSEKNWKYHLKSAAVTIASTFFTVLALALVPYHEAIVTLKPEDITWALIASGAIAFVRVVFIAALSTAVRLFIERFRK